MPAATDSRPTTIFVLGLLGLVMCQPLGIIAWIMGSTYLQNCRVAGAQPDQMAVIGRIMGMVSVALLVFALLVTLLSFVLPLLLWFVGIVVMLLFSVVGVLAGGGG